MGILDFVKQGVQEMLVHRPDDKKSLVVYKWPEQTIPAYSQLTVDADEAAVFFRDGSLVGTMRTAGAGQRHTLSSQNIPFLGRLVDNVTGGNIFVTDLYFVTMRPLRGQRFGGQLDAMVDPVLGEMITPRVFGEFAWRVEDPEKFIVNYIGLGPTPSDEEVHSWFTGLLMNSVATVVAEVLAEEERSFLQIGALRQRFAEAFVARCPAMNDIGVAITQVGQFNINVDGDDRTRLVEAQGEMGQARRDAAKARIGIEQARAEAEQRQFELDQEFQNDARYVQGLAGGDYGKYAAGKAMIGAGEGMAKGGGEGGGAGGGMMAGAGLGAGFGMAQAFSGAMAPQQAAPAAAPAAAAPAAAAPAAAGGGEGARPGGGGRPRRRLRHGAGLLGCDGASAGGSSGGSSGGGPSGGGPGSGRRREGHLPELQRAGEPRQVLHGVRFGARSEPALLSVLRHGGGSEREVLRQLWDGLPFLMRAR